MENSRSLATGGSTRDPSEVSENPNENNKKISVAILHSEISHGKMLLLNIKEVLQMKNYDVKIYRPNYPTELAILPASSNEILGCYFFPRSILGHFVILCSYIRVFISAITIMLDWYSTYDYIIVD